MPLLAPSCPLRLPAFQLAAATQQVLIDGGGFAVGVTKDNLVSAPAWTGKPILSSDRNLWPILWTPGYAATWPAGLASAYAATVRFTPTLGFGQQSTLPRMSRAVLFYARNFNPNFDQAINNWVASNTTWLDAGGVYVWRIPNSLRYANWLTAGLPLAGTTSLANPSGSLIGAVVDPSSFVAGQVFEVPYVYCDRDIGDYRDLFNPSTVDDSAAANDVAINQAVYPRYAKRYVAGFGEGGGTGSYVFNYNNGLAAQLAAYGFQPLVSIGDITAVPAPLAYYASLVPTMKSFFGL